MDCQEKEMFYKAEQNGDWISSNYAEYNEFLGIGKVKRRIIPLTLFSVFLQ